MNDKCVYEKHKFMELAGIHLSLISNERNVVSLNTRICQFSAIENYL